MLRINGQITIADNEVEIVPIRARGPGGQNVNKVASAVQLRFDIRACSLPDELKRRLLALPDQRISKDGVLVIKAGQFRSQDKNREAALQRLARFIRLAAATRKQRIATRPSRSSREKRLASKNRRGRTKALRGRVVVE
jgi:ribosome-associated protein